MTIGKGKVGRWNWEVSEVTIRKCEIYGEPYTGIVRFRFINGICYVDGLHADEFDRIDHENLKEISRLFGYETNKFVRYKEGVGILEKTV